MLWVWRDLKEHLIPTLLPWTGNHYPVEWHSGGWAAGWTLPHGVIGQEHLDIPAGNKTTSGHCWWRSMEGWSNTGPNPGRIEITAIRLWEAGIVTFHSPVRLQVWSTPELALEEGQQLEKEVASNQVPRLDAELGFLAAVSAPIHFLWGLFPGQIPVPVRYARNLVCKCVLKKV